MLSYCIYIFTSLLWSNASTAIRGKGVAKLYTLRKLGERARAESLGVSRGREGADPTKEGPATGAGEIMIGACAGRKGPKYPWQCQYII